MKSRIEDAQIDLFDWNKVPENNSILKEFLKLKFRLNWIDDPDVSIEKIDSGNTIKIMSVDDNRHSIKINLNADKTKATLYVEDKIYTYDVKAENGNELNVCDYVVYNDASEYLADEFQLLDLRLHREIQRSKKISRTDNKDQDIIGKQEQRGGALLDEELFGNYISEFEKKLLFKRKISIEKGTIRSLPLVFLSTLFELDRFEELCIVVCLAPEIDTKYERLYGYLQDNIANKFATIDLIIRVLEPSMHDSIPPTSILNRYFSSNNVFQKYHLIHFIDNFPDVKQTNTQFFHMVSTPLKLDNRIVKFLIGNNGGFDKRLDPIAELVEPDSSLADLIPFKEEFIKKVCDLTLSHYYHNSDRTIRTPSSSSPSSTTAAISKPSSNQCAIIYFLAGQDESEKKIMAKGICRLLNKKMLIIDLRESFLQGLDFEWVVEEVIREALFQQALVYIESFDKVVEDVKNESFYKAISNIITRYEKATLICCFLSSSSNILPVYLSKRHILVSIDFPYPDRNSSLVLWQAISKRYFVDEDINLDLISSKFHLGRSRIEEAFKLAENISILNHGKNYRISFEDLSKACRSLSNQKLGSIAKKVESQYTWSDIMLPSETIEQLEQICNHVKYKNIVYGKWSFERKSSRGNGLNIIFSGHSGTGKTMAAEIIANELKLDLYKIDLSLVISKYIGETEKNLGQVFNEAEERNVILFFDEADALFGKRSDVKDAHDRYANTEINYLLQKMEDYTGISILATNLKKNIDDAFLRRLNFLVDFPAPDETLRYKIWKKIFADDVPLGEDIDFEYLSKQFSITGGNIRNIAVNSAFLAASKSERVSMKHLVLAMKRELEKTGRITSRSDFGKYQHLLEHKDR